MQSKMKIVLFVVFCVTACSWGVGELPSKDQLPTGGIIDRDEDDGYGSQPLNQLPKEGIEAQLETLKHLAHRQMPEFSNEPPWEKALTWSFELDRSEYVVGEPICGWLRVTNHMRKVRWLLTEPNAGSLCATLSIWIRRTVEKKDGRTEFTYPRELTAIDEDLRAVKPGFALKSGETRAFRVPLNVYSPVSWKIAGKYPVPAFSLTRNAFKPGRYQFYVKFVNLHYAMGDLDNPYNDRQPVDHDWESDYPCRPVVVGPVDMEIKPAGTNANALATVLGRGEPNPKVIEAFLAQARDLPVSIRSGLRVQMLRGRLMEMAQVGGQNFASTIAEVPDALRPERLKQCQELQRELRDAAEREPESVLRNALQLTECFVLLWIGDQTGALKLAEKLAVEDPDAKILAHLIQRSLGPLGEAGQAAGSGLRH